MALSFTAFCFVTTEVLPIGLLTTIAGDLHRSRSQVGLLVTGYAVVVALAAFPLTLVTQRVPRRWLLGGALGFFAAATVASALAPSYPFLLAARMLIALTQAVFWSVANSAATGLFPAPPGPDRRAAGHRQLARPGARRARRDVAGPAGRLALGVPGHGRHRARGVPGGADPDAHHPAKDAGAARGAAPDTRRFVVLLVATALGVTGFLTAFTYITPYLLDVTGFARVAEPAAVRLRPRRPRRYRHRGRFLDRYPRQALIVPLVLIFAGLLGLYAFGTVKLPAIALLSMIGLAYSALAVADRGPHPAGRAGQHRPGRGGYQCGVQRRHRVRLAAGRHADRLDRYPQHRAGRRAPRRLGPGGAGRRAGAGPPQDAAARIAAAAASEALR